MPDGWKKDKIYLLLKQKILRGEFPPKMRLPNELDFCRELLGLLKKNGIHCPVVS